MFSNISHENKAHYLQMFQEAGAMRIYIAVGRDFIYRDFDEKYDEQLEHLSAFVRYYQEAGLEVGIWLNSLGFGNPLRSIEKKHAKDMTKIRAINGRLLGDAICPEDKAYTTLFCEQVRRLASVHPDLLMLDDDLCLSVRPGIGCFCEHHMRLLEEKVGRKLDAERMMEEMFWCGKNELRTAYLEVMGDTLKRFCKAVRNAVNDVDQSMRLGFCAGYTSWDLEGATAIELTHILAGDTKPFLRFTGAPYWVSKMSNRFPGQRLHNIIEFAREQAVWCKGEEIEYFNEADSYPRARYQVPANLLECFDAATVASDGMDSLKYLFDYYSPTDYETGYSKLHKKNAGLYEFLETHFHDKKAIGIQVFERMQKIEDMEFTENWEQKRIMMTALPVAAAILTAHCIPVTYEENPACGIAFNVNVDMVKNMPKKMIVDVVAAMRLQAKGIDVGLKQAVAFQKDMCPIAERFGEARISMAASAGRYYDCILAENARVESVFELDGKEIPASYIYNNGTTEFLVYTFDCYSIPQSGSVFCSYGRQEQLHRFYHQYPILKKCPYVYQLCKQGDNETVAFFANIFEDELFDFEIKLDQVYDKVECYGIEAELKGNVLKVHSEVAPYGMFAIRLMK